MRALLRAVILVGLSIQSPGACHALEPPVSTAPVVVRPRKSSFYLLNRRIDIPWPREMRPLDRSQVGRGSKVRIPDVGVLDLGEVFEPDSGTAAMPNKRVDGAANRRAGAGSWTLALVGVDSTDLMLPVGEVGAGICLDTSEADQVLSALSTNPDLRAEAKVSLAQDPLGAADLPIALDSNKRVGLEVICVDSLASLRLWIGKDSTLRDGVTRPQRAIQGLAKVLVRDQVVTMFLAKNVTLTTGAVAEFRARFRDWVAATLAANVGSEPARLPLPGPDDYVYVDELPEVIDRVPPIYPEAARVAGVSGEVVVAALVDDDGQVLRTRVVRSVKGLDEAAAIAVRQWVFRPAQAGGESVAVWVHVPVRFKLE